jgi:hypothetical protein
LELEDGTSKATITGLRMPHVTTPFPIIKLMEAWEDAQAHAKIHRPGLALPSIDKEVGGGPVDILLGIKYLQYFPKLVYSLPSGLQVYRAVFRSASNNQAVLGGPHAAWSRMVEMTQHMNPRAYLSAEVRAWYMGEKWVEINQGRLSNLSKFALGDPVEEHVGHGSKGPGQNSGCTHCLCDEDSVEYTGIYTTTKDEKRLWQVEDLGTESPYRCVDCRNCVRCRNGDEIEAISLKEEAEQALIEKSVELDPVDHIV